MIDRVPGQDPLDRALNAAFPGGVAVPGTGLPESQANAAVQPNPPTDEPDPREQQRALLAALYGPDCPLAFEQEPTDEDWVRWVKGRWEAHAAAVETHLHLVQRNRLFRAGQQWVSSRHGGPWAEPQRPRESVRRVYNLIKPALRLRLQVLSDQRPGFKVTPASSDPDEQRRAEARQQALDYQYDQQQMDRKRQEAAYWAQTDGVAFWHTYWDPDRGAWDDRMGEGAGDARPLGDLNTEVLRVEQVRVSANATATTPPAYVVIRKAIPAIEAAARWGVTGALAARGRSGAVGQSGATTIADPSATATRLQWSNVGDADRLRAQDTADHYRLYLAPHPDVLPKGLDVVVVGDALVVGPMDLHVGAIPVTPVRDGSEDPSYYPRPEMEGWIESQKCINQVVSKWTDSVRVNAGGRFAGRPNAIAQETFLGGLTSVLEIKGAGPLSDAILPLPSFSVGQDAKELLALDTKFLEDGTGNNDTTRGQVASDQSGRAILAAREQVERIFAPSVTALAQAFTDWGKICLRAMAWGYDVPRTLKVVGASRPDLARQVSRADLDGVNDVFVEPVTLMPMPFSLRQFLLDSWLDRGLIDAREYRRRSIFASTKSMATPDEDQEARASRVAEALLTGAPVPAMRWQDNEAIHQDVLERRILLRDDIDPTIVDAADQRWKALANQAAQKQGLMQPPAMPGAPSAPGGGPPGAGSPFQPPPQDMPLASANPAGLPGAGATMQQDATQQFEAGAPQ